jgi:hypothetical protein
MQHIENAATTLPSVQSHCIKVFESLQSLAWSVKSLSAKSQRFINDLS